MLLILVLIIKSLSKKTTKFTKFFFPIAVFALTCIDLDERGFGKDTASRVFPNSSKINVFLTLKCMYLKAILLVSFHTAGTLRLSCHGQTIFNNFFSLHCHFWISLSIFLVHFYCFTLRVQCTSKKFFLFRIFPNKKISLFVHFVHSNCLPYLPEK